MADKTDAVTRWWRRISLRAKVTGVTVAVLAMGLFVAGVGTSFVLYSALLNNVDETVTHLVQTEDVAERLLSVSQSEDGTIQITPNDDDLSMGYYIALYGPDGALIGSAGGIGDDEEEPDFPAELTPDRAKTLESTVFALTSDSGERFRASAAVVELPDTNTLYSQVIAMGEADTLSVVRTYFVVFTFVAIMTIVAGAFLTRWVVTLTFRRFGQVEETAMAIAGGDFGQRLPATEPRTEIGRLTIAINTMLDRIDESIEQRESTVRQMRRFIGDASHELRTPLVSVRGYAELYRMGAITNEEDLDRTMERIEKEAIRMGALVEDLLALARLDEKRPLEITAIDLRALASDAAMDARAADGSREIRVVDRTPAAAAPLPPRPAPPASDDSPRRAPTALERATTSAISILRRRPKGAPTEEEMHAETRPVPRLPRPVPPPAPIVLGEDHKVRQVVANLLGNARRYSPDGSPIELEVGTDAAAGMGWIAVVDHGEGVPEAIRSQIFQRFWRADTSRARETGGSGLGLAIVSSIVEAHHGTVSVAETPGGGATFRVSLPLQGRNAG
ncbi:sensor histidine kinase [Microbacterium halophytorum]|uniref:sensor histidine kinase n=1 Tax=Microbacterium halophytorum TaxID=2067568 RepID=UPI001E396CFA|nr:HAMP domain-containing sensor histidine kinase [Microbacterium halophytorum]